MPEYLHLPPVAAALVTITGVLLAVIRLLTASKAFWWRFPEWLQKGLPAALVALGTLPTALEHAKSWLDVMVAFVFAVGAWFTASRGDKRPVEPKTPSPDETVRIVPPLGIFLLLAGLVLPQQACKPASPPTFPKVEHCSTVELATIMAGCEARIRLECKTDDKSCLVFQECKLAVKNWRACGEADL